jgi:outer membrane protein assembly factor BamA
LVPLPIPGSPILALRVGAKRVWGSFPVDEAAFLGGQGTLRGFEYQRFAGDAMVNGSVEVRIPFARILPRVVPTQIGVFGLGDAGLSFFEARNRVSLARASGREGDRWYLRWGLGW